MSPTVPGAMWREAESGGISVDGEHIPAGYDVGTCIYAVHHNEAYFGDSFSFLPDRWLSGSAEEKLQAAQSAYNPFSFGPRGCVGRTFALIEIGITVAHVLWLMDFRMSGQEAEHLGEGKRGGVDGRDRVNEYQIYSHLTSYSYGPMLEFRKRIA
jgi:cytochrome P450